MVYGGRVVGWHKHIACLCQTHGENAITTTLSPRFILFLLLQLCEAKQDIYPGPKPFCSMSKSLLVRNTLRLNLLVD